MSDTREDLKRTAKELISECKYKEALSFAIRFVDQHHDDGQLFYILVHVTFEEEEMRRMENPLEGDASSFFLLGYRNEPLYGDC